MSENKPKEFVVYRIYHIDSGKSYIGITTDYKNRIYSHFHCHGHCWYLYNAINKHGKNNFKHEVIFECNSWEELCKKEIECIKIYDTKAPSGYNLTNGGDGLLGVKHSDKARKKMSESQKGRIVSEETRNKMSMANKGRIPSEETRNKLSIAGKGRIFSDKHKQRLSKANTGKKHSDKTKRKISKNSKNISNETRRRISEGGKKLSDNQILEIRKILSKGVFQKDIAKKFNTHQTTISCIKLNKVYADIQLPKEV